MNVLTLFTGLFDSTGGIQTFNRSLVRALAEIARDHQVSTTALVLTDRDGAALAAQYVDTDLIRCRGFAGSRVAFASAALRAARKADCVVVGHVNFAPLARVFRALRRNSRLLLIVHGVDVWRRLPLLVRSGVDRCDGILSVSEYTRDRMIRENPTAESRFSILPCTLDPLHDGRATALVPEPRLPHGRMILSVARLAPSEQRKGIDHVIRAMPELLRDHPDLQYVIAGDGADRGRLERLAIDLRVADHVSFVGRVPDDELPAYYRACELFVLPSTKEGFGIVFLEAMYHRKACVCARAGGAKEVVADGETGLLAEPDDVAGLAHAIATLLVDPATCRRMGEAGRRRFDERFSPQMFRERVARILMA